MKTFSFTTGEVERLKQAVAQLNDFMNDTIFENLSVNLFPRDGEETVLNSENTKGLQEALYAAFEEYHEIRSLAAKLGLEVNEQGYSQ